MASNPETIKTKKRALSLIGGSLGEPSKMPGLSYGFSARHCITGSKLREVEGSVCSACYACKGNYTFPYVATAHERRHASLSNPEWVAAMIFAIAWETARIGVYYFRWHDSGDLQGYWHLLNIVEIARELPRVKFWLPTKEKRLIKRYLRENGSFPKNLAVRLSATMIDSAPSYLDGAAIGYSTVSQDAAPIGEMCRAYTRGGKCNNCRKCWNTRKYPVISYPKH